MIKCTDQNGIWSVGFCGGGKTGEPSEQGREPTTSQPTCYAGAENRTRATVVEGECSPQCAIPAFAVMG